MSTPASNRCCSLFWPILRRGVGCLALLSAVRGFSADSASQLARLTAAEAVIATYGSALSVALSARVSSPTALNFESAELTDAVAALLGGEERSANAMKLPATIDFTELRVTYDGGAKQPFCTTSPAGLNVVLAYNGSAQPPVSAGQYRITATIDDADYTGSAAATLVIEKAEPQIRWTQPAPITYGTPLGAAELNATANFPGTFTYLPAAGAILNAGPGQALSAVFTPADPANVASVTAVTTLTVNRATALVNLTDLSQSYDGAAKAVTGSTVPANLKLAITYDDRDRAPVLPGPYAVVARIDDPNYVGSTAEVMTITVTALVRHAPRIAGAIDGSTQVLSPENVVVGGTAWISGDILVPGLPSLNIGGLPMLGGSHDADGASGPSSSSVTLTGTAVMRYLVRRVDPLPLPAVDVPAVSTGTRHVSLNATTDTVSDWTTVRSIAIAAGAGPVAVPAGRYEEIDVNPRATLVLGHADAAKPELYEVQHLTLAGGSVVRIEGPVLLVVANPVIVTGTVGNPDHPEWLTLAAANGGVTLQSRGSLAGYVIAPNGTVAIGNGSTLLGEISADRLVVAESGELVEP